MILKSLPRNPPNCPILCNRVFDNFILVEELFAKALRSLKTFVLVNNNLHVKLFSSLKSPTIFDESFKVTSVAFFTPTILRLKRYIFYAGFILKQNKITIFSQFLGKNLKWSLRHLQWLKTLLYHHLYLDHHYFYLDLDFL